MDTSRLKAKIAELKSEGGNRRNTWKPKPGKQVIRIVPYIHDTDWPFVELYFHYNIAKQTVLSPVSFNRPDPISEFAEMLKATGDQNEWKRGAQLEPKRRIYVPVLVRGEEAEGVKYWGFGKQIYEQLTDKMDDPDWGDITHPLNGRDITVTFEKATGPKTFPTTKIDVKPVTSPVTESQEVLNALTQMEDITKLWDEPSYDELKALLQAYVQSGDKVDAPTEASTLPPRQDTTAERSAVAEAPPVSTAAASTSKADIMNAFGNYFQKTGTN